VLGSIAWIICLLDSTRLRFSLHHSESDQHEAKHPRHGVSHSKLKVHERFIEELQPYHFGGAIRGVRTSPVIAKIISLTLKAPVKAPTTFISISIFIEAG